MGPLQHMADKSDAESFVNRAPSSVGRDQASTRQGKSAMGSFIKKTLYTFDQLHPLFIVIVDQTRFTLRRILLLDKDF